MLLVSSCVQETYTSRGQHIAWLKPDVSRVNQNPSQSVKEGIT